MKLQTAKSAVLSIRCAHRDSSGRQCRLLTSDAHSGLCPQHRAGQEQELAADHFKHLTTKCQFFQTAQGINYSLLNLYQLLAQNRISPRRAAVLAYISSMLLRTLPQIDADKAADAEEDDEDSDLDPADDHDSETESNTITLTHTDVDPNSTNTWDPSIPEPDPKKKPS
jgi:hypothetical protein